MNRVLPLSRITLSTAKSKGIVVLALACSLTLSACASPLAPSAKPDNFYEAVRSDAEKFWADYFSSHSVGHTRRLRKCSCSPGRSVACGPFDSRTVLLRRRTEVVYLDSGFMQTHLSDIRRLWARDDHCARNRPSHPELSLVLPRIPSIRTELQADCLAGGWVKDAGARGLLEDGDYHEAATTSLR